MPAISFKKNIHFSIAKSWQRAKSLGALLTCAVRPGPVDHTPDYQRPETVTDGWIRIKTEIKKLMSLLRYIFFYFNNKSSKFFTKNQFVYDFP